MPAARLSTALIPGVSVDALIIPLAHLTCPACGTRVPEPMPTESCLYFYECRSCRCILRPNAGDCCVFCSYGDRQCPSRQAECHRAETP